jgi:AcrR family transcriptional regulator
MNVVQSHREGRSERRVQRRGRREHGREDRRRSLRARRAVKPAEERRRDILDAALRLFVQRGFNETTVGDIAQEAGMGTGTVYLYFPSKEHVLLGLHERFREENDALVAASAVDAVERGQRGEPVDFRDTVNAIIDAVAQTFVANRDLAVVCTKYRPELADPEYNPATEHSHMVARALAEGVRLGFIHTSDPEMTAYLFDAALAFNLHTHVAYGDPPDLDRFVAAAKEMIHKTLALPADAPSRIQAPPRTPARARRSQSRHRHG